MKVPVIAVDGPSGAGKGTLCRLLAQHLGWHLLDSGSIYRLTALAALRGQIPLQDSVRLAAAALELAVYFQTAEDKTLRILLQGEDVSDAIRNETVSNVASKVAAIPAVREALLKRQRAFRQAPGLVADGRDMGTVVFPDAQVKIFLTASTQERALRRHKQLKEKGFSANLPQLEQGIAERDERDAEREVSPLRPALDAKTLDSTGLEIGEVQEQALAIINKQL